MFTKAIAAAEIYGLFDPRTNELRYIGKANNAQKRLKSHLRDADRRNTPVYCWIRKLRDLGLTPRMQVLEIASDWKEAERRLIAVSRARGDKLLNVADGGDEPYCNLGTRISNAKTLNKDIAADPLRRWLRETKRRMITAYLRGELKESTIVKLRAAAAKNPAMFACFADLRVENAR